ncbi:unnamed protein product, partial [Mesorhabditis belari]|uniref:Uncharacterized protein n=1 Tax=Mesorhabditis belari TaxID=2138241 RepID=A0AAF3FB07_9BILA
MSKEDKLFLLLHHIVETPGIILSITLLVIITRSTPPWLKSYSILIGNSALTDLIACLVNMFVMQRMIPVHLSLFYISYGYCTFFGPRVCYLGYCTVVYAMTDGLYSLAISFLYRYYVLIHSGSIKKGTLLLICFLVSTPSIMSSITFSTCDDDPAVLRPLLTSALNYNLTNLQVSGHITILKFWTMYTITFTIGCTGVSYMIMFWCRRRVLMALSIMDLSPKTRAIHRELRMALTVQSLLPLVLVFCASLYGIQQMGIVHSPTFEHLIYYIVAFQPVLSPIFSIYFVRPYRESVLKLVNRWKPQKKSLVSVSNTAATSSGVG